MTWPPPMAVRLAAAVAFLLTAICVGCPLDSWLGSVIAHQHGPTHAGWLVAWFACTIVVAVVAVVVTVWIVEASE